jgi:hypothetical protein
MDDDEIKKDREGTFKTFERPGGCPIFISLMIITPLAGSQIDLLS